MKICKNCKTIYQDNSETICPKCNTLLFSDYSLYDQKDLVNDISNNSKTLWSVSWRVFLMIFSVLGILGVITGYNIYGHLRGLNEQINNRISDEFEKPNITETIKNVATENADKLIKEEIEPEVNKFKNTIDNLISRTDLLIENKSNAFTIDLAKKTENIDKKISQIDNSVSQIKKAEAKILTIANEMNSIKELAKPPTLIQTDFKMDSISNGLKLTIEFKPNKNEPLGLIKFKVTMLDDSKLLKIGTDVIYGAYSRFQNRRITKNKIGEFEYSLIGTGHPTLVIEVSKKCNFQIESNYLDKPFVVTKNKY